MVQDFRKLSREIEDQKLTAFCCCKSFTNKYTICLYFKNLNAFLLKSLLVDFNKSKSFNVKH